jgi:hypothetical protein
MIAMILIVFSFKASLFKIQNKTWKLSCNIGQNSYVYSCIFQLIFNLGILYTHKAQYVLGTLDLP